jgi:RNA polymerase sigma-70 factor (ECF subfamily)
MPDENDAPDPPDADLVARAQAGDLKAFDELVRRHSPRLYSLIYHMTSHREDTNDLLQDVFAKAYRSLERFRSHSQFYTWLYSIATNMTLNFLKKRNRRSRAMSLDDLDAGTGSSSSSSRSSSAGVGLFDDMADFSFSENLTSSEHSLGPEFQEMETSLTEVE